jgi:hypothetical protein
MWRFAFTYLNTNSNNNPKFITSVMKVVSHAYLHEANFRLACFISDKCNMFIKVGSGSLIWNCLIALSETLEQTKSLIFE